MHHSLLLSLTHFVFRSRCDYAIQQHRLLAKSADLLDAGRTAIKRRIQFGFAAWQSRAYKKPVCKLSPGSPDCLQWLARPALPCRLRYHRRPREPQQEAAGSMISTSGVHPSRGSTVFSEYVAESAAMMKNCWACQQLINRWHFSCDYCSCIISLFRVFLPHCIPFCYHNIAVKYMDKLSLCSLAIFFLKQISTGT